MKRTVRKGRTTSFVLTLEEKKVICFVLLAFLFGLFVKQYREKHPPPASALMQTAAKSKRPASPAKSVRINDSRSRQQANNK